MDYNRDIDAALERLSSSRERIRELRERLAEFREAALRGGAIARRPDGPDGPDRGAPSEEN